MRPWRKLALAVGVVYLALASACGDGPVGVAPVMTRPAAVLSGTIARVAMTPTTASVPVGATTTLAALAYSSSGTLVTGGTFGWTSNNKAVATVSGGVVTGVAPGTATIKVGSGGFTAMCTITVTPVMAASLTLAPASASVPVGGTLQLAATVKDASGSILTTRPMTWSSSAAPVATVSATGAVSGVAAGSATVTAAVDGQTATSQVTVTASTPPPPLPPPPPTVGGVLFADGFEAGYAAKQNNAGWTNTAPVNVTVSTDVAHSGTHSLRFSFPGKVDCNDASAQQAFTLGRTMTEVWLEYYAYFPKGGESGSAPYYHRSQAGCKDASTNNKFFTVYGPKYAGETTMSLQTWTTVAGAAGDSRVNTAYSKAGRSGIWFYGANDDPFVGAADRGQWMQIRVHLRLASFGQSNGVIEVWKNGTKILSNTTLDWYDSTNTANYMTQGYLMGWSNSGFTQMTNIYLDDFKIIDQNPGW
jgi:hypothetical protein